MSRQRDLAEVGASEWGRDLGDPIAVLRTEPDGLARVARVTFVAGHDDLDRIQVGRVSLRAGHDCLLVKHLNKPFGGTEVVPLGDSKDPAADLTRLLSVLQLSPKALSWVRADIGAIKAPTSAPRAKHARRTPRPSSRKTSNGTRRAGVR